MTGRRLRKVQLTLGLTPDQYMTAIPVSGLVGIVRPFQDVVNQFPVTI